MALIQPAVQNVVKLNKGQKIILPADAKVISVTNVNGGLAESLCPLPDPTPLVAYTFYFDRRAEGQGGQFHPIMLFRYFILGNSKTSLTGTASQDSYLQDPNTPWVVAMKATQGVAALYVCSECNGSGCGNLVTIEVPKSLAQPYFIMTEQDNDMDPWFLRVYPLDYDLPGQVDRGTCGNKM